MHSSLRKELCGTPKILKSIRAQSVSRHNTRTRAFSSRPHLRNQPGSKDNNPSIASDPSAQPQSSNDPSSSSSAPAHGLGADLEKWIQILSERGQPLDVWDTISEKDENGKRRLLPHIKKELEQIGQQVSHDGAPKQSFGLEIKDGRIRPLTPNELQQENVSGDNSDGQREKVMLRSNSGGKGAANNRDLQAEGSPIDQPNIIAGETQQKPQTQVNTSQEVTPQVIESNIITKFHGSSAARRQRERQSRFREKSHIVILPDWFTDRNVLLWGERNLRPSQATDVGPIWQNEKVLSMPIYDMAPSASEVAEGSELLKEVEEQKKEDDVVPEKEQTFASGPDGDEPTNNSSNADDPEQTALPRLIPLAKSKKRYYIHSAQRNELITTAKGRLRLPAAGSSTNKPGGIRSHILVHYLAKDGDLFLDRLVEDVARSLHCNLVTLDVQDITALIQKADIDPMMADEAKTLSYEVYSEIYKDHSQEDEDQAAFFPGEMDEADEESGSGGPQGFPFMVGKPITIDLKALFGPTRSRRNSNPFMPKPMVPEMMGRSSISKPVPHIFQPLVDSILSSPNNRRKMFDAETSLESSNAPPANTPSQPLFQEATIVHVKDLKAIQETNIGKHFLSQLYDQVERRRGAGEAIMLIGTSCERANVTQFDADRIRNLQVSEPDEISSTIVITPAYSCFGTTTRDESEAQMRESLQRLIIPKQDRDARIQMINARHLFEMLQTKDVPLESLKEGFWTKELSEQLQEQDRECLAKSFWSFSHVQRLAAVLAGSSSTDTLHPIADAVKILDHSDKLKYDWINQAQTDKPKRAKRDKDGHEIDHDKLAQIRAKATKHEKKLLSGVVEPQKISTTFQDIHIPPETVEALQTLTTLSLIRPDAFNYGVLASDRIPGLLLYGPPGTGKTLAAKAVARESGATMLEVSAADINDMYVGEGEKNVKALFSLAKKLSPCVVFLDEADAMFSARSNAGRRVSHRELLNQFLKEWDGMSNDSGSAFIMVATNRPMDLDDAVLRRLPRRLLVDLPTENDRLEILKIHLRHEHLADDVDLANLASRTQFYSGSDLKNVAVAAALSCVREENQLAKEHKGEAPYQYPEKRVLTAAHFDRALEEISASISEDMASLRDIKKFDEQYGDRKGRKKRSAKWGFKTSAEADAVLDTVKVRS